MGKIKLYSKITDLPSNDYHAVKNTVSSSQLKDLLGDPDVFYKKYISKEIPRKHSPAFDVGTYVHSGVLEPHNLDKDCVIYPGKVRSGAKWISFKEKHKGKAILTGPQGEQAKKLIEVTKTSPITMFYVDNCEPEVSMFVRLHITEKHIYCVKRSMVLTRKGWEPCDIKDYVKEAPSVIVKVRADGLGYGWVFDLKTTSGNARSKSEMRDAIGYYNYSLSAALYLDMFTIGIGTLYDTFIWGFVSKKFQNVRSYTVSNDNILEGRRQYSEALLTLARKTNENWEDKDFLDVL